MARDLSGSNRAPDEFDDLSQEVVDGAGRITTALSKIIKAAGEADTAHKELAKAQSEAGSIAKEYAEALKAAENKIGAVVRESSASVSNVKSIGKGLGSAKSDMSGIARSLGNIAKQGAAVGVISNFGAASGTAASDITDLKNRVEDVATAMGKIKEGKIDFNIDNAKKALGEIQGIVTELQGYKLGMRIELDSSDFDTEFVDKFADKVQRSGNLRVKVACDASDFCVEEVGDLEKRMKELSGQKAKVAFEVDETSVTQALDAIQAVEDLSDVKVSLTVTADNLSGVQNELQDIGVGIELIENTKAKIHLDTDDVDMAVEKLEGIAEVLKNLNLTAKVGLDTSDVDAADMNIKFNVDKDIINELDEINIALEQAKKTGDLGEQIKLEVEAAQLKILQQYVNGLDETTKKTITLAEAQAALESDTGRLGKAYAKAAKIIQDGAAFDAFGKQIDEAINDHKKFINEVKNGQRALDKAEFVMRGGDIGELEAFKRIVGELSDPLIKAKIAGMDVGEAMQYVRDNVANAASAMDEARKSGVELAKSSKELTGEIEKQGNALDILIGKYNEGVSEADSFAGGIGKSGGRMIGAGVAAAWLFTKMGELANQFKDAAVELARFNVDLAATERGINKINYQGQLEDIRNDAKLTREQFSAFVEVLDQGTGSGVANLTQLAEANKKLQDAFGGDQTERLREYVELLQLIPTLDADLQISADLDDQAAAIFGLAQEGKVSSLIELQTAGLLGGVDIQATREEVGLLNSQQRTEKTIQDIQDTLLGFFPSWGPQFAAIADGTLKVFGAFGGVVAGIGFLSAVTGKQIAATGASAVSQNTVATGLSAAEVAAQNATTAAVLGSAGRGAAGRAASGAGRAASGAGRAASGAGRAASGVSSGLSTAAKAVRAALGGLTLPLTAVSIAAGFAGKALMNTQDDIAEGSDDASASLARLSGQGLKATSTIAGFAATGFAVGAAMGAIGGPLAGITGAAGAVVGGLVGLGRVVTTQSSEFGAALEDFGGDLQSNMPGTELKKFGPVVQALGGTLEGLVTGIRETAQGVSAWAKENDISLKSVAKTALIYGTLPGLLFKGTQKLVEWGVELDKSKAQKEAERKAAAASVKVDESRASATAKANAATRQLEKIVVARAKSALALQRASKGIELAFNSAKLQLVKFRQDLGQAEVEKLQNIGGAAGEFESVITRLSGTVSDRFEQVTDALETERTKILADADLQGEQRRQALELISQKELEAVNDLIEGLDAVTDALLNSPKVIEAGLKAQIGATTFDFETDFGTASIDDAGRGLENAAAKVEELTAAIEGQRRVTEELNRTRETVAAQQEIREKNFLEAIKKGDAAGKSLAAQFERLEGVEVTTEIDPESGDKVLKLNKELDTLKASLADLSVQAAASDKKLRDATKGIDEVIAVQASEGLRKVDDELGKVSEALNLAQGKLAEAEAEKLSASAEDLAEAYENVTKAEEEVAKWQKKQEELKTQQTQAEEAIKKQLQAAIEKAGGTGDAQKDLATFYKVLRGNAQLSEKEAKLAEKWLEQLGNGSAEQQKAFREYRKLLEENAQLIADQSATKSLIGNSNAEIALTKQRLKAIQSIDEQGRGLIDELQKAADRNFREVRDAERVLEAREAQARIAVLTGDAVAGQLAVQESQVDVLTNQFAAVQKQLDIQAKTRTELEKAAKEQQKQVDAANAALETAKSGGDEGAIKAAREAAEAAAFSLATLEGSLKTIDDQSVALQQKAAQAADAINQLGTGFDQVLQAFEEGLTGRELAAEFELDDVLFEAAEFSENFTQITAKAFSKTVKAASRNAKERTKIVKENAAQQKRLIQQQLDAGAITQVAAASKRRTLDAKTQAELAKIETQQKQKVLDAAKKEGDIAKEDIDIRQSVIDAELDYLSTVGGNLDSFVQLQNQGVALEREKLKVLEKEAKVSREQTGDSLRTRRLEAEVIKQGFNLRKKEFGVQKDIFDKIIGSAFGQIRSNFGASRQRLSDVALGGIADTRVVTQSGLLVGAGPGGVKTVDERRNERELAGFGADIRGAFAGRGAGGVEGDAPGKSVEEQLFDETKSNAAANAEMADKGVPFFEAGMKEGSIFVHDSGLHDRVDTLIDIVRRCCGNIGDIATSSSAGEGVESQTSALNKISGGQKAEAKAANIQVQRLAVMQKELKAMKDSGVSQTEIAKKEVEIQNQELAVSKITAKMNAEIAKADKKAVDKIEQAKEAEQASSQRSFNITAASNAELVNQLKMSRMEAKNGISSILGTGLTGEGSDEAFSQTAAKLQEVVDIEREIKNREITNPVAGAAPQIREIGRILSGTLPAEVKQFKKLTEAREKIKQEERSGRERETGEKRRTQRIAQTAITSGRIEQAGIDPNSEQFKSQQAKIDADKKANREKISNLSSGEKDEFFSNFMDNMKGAAPPDVVQGQVEKLMKETGTSMTPAIRNKMAGLTEGSTDSAGTSARSGTNLDEFMKRKLTNEGVLSRFGTDVERGSAAQAKAVERGVRAAQQTSLTAGGGRGTSGVGGGRFMTSFGSKMSMSAREISGITKEDSIANGVAVMEAAIGKNRSLFNEMNGQEDRRIFDGLGNLIPGAKPLPDFEPVRRGEVDGINYDYSGYSDEEKQQRDEYFSRIAKEDGINYDYSGYSDEEKRQRDEYFSRIAKEDMTKSGGEVLAESTGKSITGAKAAKEEATVPGKTGVKAEEKANQEVVPDITKQASAEELGRQQQGLGAFDNNPAFQAQSGFSNLGSGGNAQAPVMKVEGTMKVEFNNAAFKSTIAAVVGEAILTAENIDALSRDLKGKGFVTTKN